MKMIMRYVSLLVLAFVIVFGTLAKSEAGIARDRLPLQCYASQTIKTYKVPFGSSVGYIDPYNDLIEITQVRDDDWVYGSYPTPQGRVSRWFYGGEIFSDQYSANSTAYANGNQYVFRTRGSNARLGSISNGEEVIVVANDGQWSQIVYRLDNGKGYKMGWVPSAAVGSRTMPSSPQRNPQQLQRQVSADTSLSGNYYIVPETNGDYSLDVKGGGAAPEQTDIQLFNKHGGDAQIFELQRVSGDWYVIKHERTGYVINVAFGNHSNGTGVWLYRYDGTDSCLWRFLKKDNGSYQIESKLPTNPILELQNNNAYPGGRIQLWQHHNGQAGMWKLIPVGSQSIPQPQPQQTRRQALRTLEAYQDSSLQKRIGRVDEGDICTVLEETSNAYRLEYPTPNGSKVGWVNKSIFEEHTILNGELEKLINEWKGRIWHDGDYAGYNANGQPNFKECKEFASYIFNKLYGVRYIGGGSTEKNSLSYKINNPQGVNTIGITANLTLDNVRDLFRNAQPGDFVQMRRRNTNSRGYHNPHSAILVRKDENGVEFFEANANKEHNKIYTNTYSYFELVNKNMAMSIYHAK